MPWKCSLRVTGEFATGSESGAVRPAQPPPDGGEISIGQDFLESLAQADGSILLHCRRGRWTDLELLIGALRRGDYHVDSIRHLLDELIELGLFPQIC